ncbi:MAG: NADH-quinone oxidoreductase subunit NuoE [Desulfofustis sp.]|jgi:NADH-quinone oxidoreductase subunit E|nr:NADH-quinone oxidoreductase subunit NuoE [Desulfofustis sp.]
MHVQESLDTHDAPLPQVLIMEDEVSVARGLGMVLSEEGYNVDLAMTGRSALDSFNRKMFDLLVADLRLPDIDGIEVIRQVKRRRPDTEVLVITGYSTVNTAVEAMKLGASDYLSKPFTQDEFLSAVKVALHTREFPSVERAEPPLEPLPEDALRLAEAMARVRESHAAKQEEVIPILQCVQNAVGYLSPEALMQVAEYTGMPEAAVYGVATFYERFRLSPVGRHVVKVCRGTACHVKGVDKILSAIEDRYHLQPGQTSKDRRFTLETVACFGACAIAPVVVVDDEVRANMDPGKVGKVLDDLAAKESAAAPASKPKPH